MRALPIVGLLAVVGCAHTTASKPPAAAEQRSPTEQRLDAMTASLEHEDFEGALRDTDRWLDTGPDLDTRALIYNCRTWIRWGGGDKPGAMAENEKLREVVDGADEKTKRSHLLHYWWDRAYLEAEAGRAADADRSRAEFERLGNTPDDADSRKVLEAYLLYERGDGAGAKAAASAVDLAKDGDLQDLYVVALALEAGGDAAGAEKVRERIRRAPSYPMKPLILQEMVRDATRAAKKTP